MLFLFELFLLLPDHLQVFELPHELVHRVLLHPYQLLETVDLRVLLKDSPLGPIQLLPVFVLHFRFKILNVTLKVILLDLGVLLADVKFLLEEPFLGFELPLGLEGALFLDEAVGH